MYVYTYLVLSIYRTNHDILRQLRSIIVLSFDHCSFDQLKISNHSLRAREPASHFLTGAWFQLRMSRIFSAAKHSFVASYLKVTWVCFRSMKSKEKHIE